MAVRVRVLGPGVVGFPISGSALDGDLLYVVSRNLSPARLALFDLHERRVLAERRIPTGAGAWGVTTTRAAVWLGMFGARGARNLYRFGTRGRDLRAVASLDALYVWALATAPDDTVVGALDPAAVVTYDGEVDLLGGFAPGELLRSVAATRAAIWVGGGRDGRATLRTIDRGTGTRRDRLPPALAGDQNVYTLVADRGLVVGGTRGPGNTDAALFLLDGDTPPVIVRLRGEQVVDAIALARNRRTVYATARASGALYRYERGGALQRLAVPVRGSETRQAFARGRHVVGTSAPGLVWRVDTRTGKTTVIDLLAHGLRGRPMLPQSIAAGAGRVAVGGNFGLQVRVVGSSGVSRAFVPGEPKDMVYAGSTLWLAVYPVGELWRLDDGAPARAAQLPPEQNRPQTIIHHAPTGELIVSTAADRIGGGGLHRFDPATGTLRSVIDPLGPGQHPAGLAVIGATLFIGGSGADASLLAWDLLANRALWEMAAFAPGAGTVVGLTVARGRLFGLTSAGDLVVVDPDTRALVHRARVSSVGGQVLTSRDLVWGAGADEVVAVDPRTFAVEVVARGLDPQVWGWPKLAADEAGRLYAFKRMNVAQLTP